MNTFPFSVAFVTPPIGFELSAICGRWCTWSPGLSGTDLEGESFVFKDIGFGSVVLFIASDFTWGLLNCPSPCLEVWSPIDVDDWWLRIVFGIASWAFCIPSVLPFGEFWVVFFSTPWNIVIFFCVLVVVLLLDIIRQSGKLSWWSFVNRPYFWSRKLKPQRCWFWKCFAYQKWRALQFRVRNVNCLSNFLVRRYNHCRCQTVWNVQKKS